MKSFCFTAVLAINVLIIGEASLGAVKLAKEPPECRIIVKACQNAGFTLGRQSKTSQGVWLRCVLPLSKGKTVRGVKNVKKNSALACLKARQRRRKAVKV